MDSVDGRYRPTGTKVAGVKAMTPVPSATRAALLCGLAIAGFAGNSLLTRLALRPRLIDAASFALVRLVTGAAALMILARLRNPPASLRHGSWVSALLLFGYAAPFSFAYLHMGAGAGALVLFGSVQVSMIGWGLWRGERPRVGEWAGLLLALAGSRPCPCTCRSSPSCARVSKHSPSARPTPRSGN